MTFLYAFLIGGAICMLAQILVNLTKLTTARILVIVLLTGILLQAVGIYQYIVDFAGAGATIPLSGFGFLLAKGAMEGAKTNLLEGLIGGMKATATGLTAAIVFGFLIALIFRARSKKL